MPRKFKIYDYDSSVGSNPPPKKAQARLWEVKVFPKSAPSNGPAEFEAPAGAWPDFSQNPNPDHEGRDAFRKWVDHYVRVVGYHISVLNGLQFDLEQHNASGAGGTRNILAAFAEKIDQFATALHILNNDDYGADPINPNGPGNPNSPRDPLAEYPINPKQLVWPLIGYYYFRFHFRRVNDPQVQGSDEEYNYYADLSLRFETDLETNLCTNCALALRVTDAEGKLDGMGAVGTAGVSALHPDYISSSSSYTATSSSSS